MNTVNTRVRTILRTHGRLSMPVEQLTDSTDLFSVGLDSMAMVNVMLAIESEFDLEFSDRLLVRSSFATINALEAVVGELQAMA